MPRSHGFRLTVTAACALILLACGRDKVEEKGDVDVSFSGDSSGTIKLGRGDVKITSIDGSFVMAVVGDTVRMQLSDSLRAKVRQDVGKSADSAGGLGATIARSVGGIVDNALGFVVRVPVQDVENLRYENGKLRFDVRGSDVNVQTSGNSGKAEFTEADALLFIDAVVRRQRAKGAT